MSIYVKSGGVYKRIYNVWVKQDGIWKLLETIHYKFAGSWKLLNTALYPFYFTKVISTNTSNFNLRDAAIAAGWDTIVPLVASVTINSGVTVSSSSISSYAFSTGSVFPESSRLTLTNNGVIVGRGGVGGKGGSGASTAATAGTQGGPAMFIALPTDLINNGSIGGGGGGGGGGRVAHLYNPSATPPDAYFGGGGGGGGIGLGAGGAGGSTTSMYPYVNAVAGVTGTGAARGTGGAGGYLDWNTYLGTSSSNYTKGDTGGPGGGYASSGGTASGGGNNVAMVNGESFNMVGSVGGVGVGGSCISGFSFVTLSGTGKTYGANS